MRRAFALNVEFWLYMEHDVPSPIFELVYCNDVGLMAVIPPWRTHVSHVSPRHSTITVIVS